MHTKRWYRMGEKCLNERYKCEPEASLNQKQRRGKLTVTSISGTTEDLTSNTQHRKLSIEQNWEPEASLTKKPKHQTSAQQHANNLEIYKDARKHRKCSIAGI
jgi:hypothetical protein